MYVCGTSGYPLISLSGGSSDIAASKQAFDIIGEPVVSCTLELLVPEEEDTVCCKVVQVGGVLRLPQ